MSGDSDQCTCTDCAIAQDVITKIDGQYSTVYVDEDGDTYLDAEDAEVEVDEAFQCDTCGDVHMDTTDAEECCHLWECNYCGWQSHSGGYSTAREQAANCCVIHCDECDASGWPDFMSNHECNPAHEDGMRQQLPWEARGIVVDGRYPDQGDKWKATWAIEPKEHNVVRAAADYYLLEAIKAGLVGTVDAETETIFSEEKQRDVELVKPNSTVANHTLMRIIRDEAQAAFDTLVATWDPILQAYTHMAVGGELRHHRAVGGEVLSSTRDSAWSGWKTIFEAVGTDALTDAAALFHEFSGGSFGGKPWADACLILHKRLTGQINPALFLDRIFNAQHNGGCLLNKVRWAGDEARYGTQGTNPADGMSVEEMTNTVLPAHGAEPEPDYSTLLAFASKAVRSLFTDAHEMGRRARLDMGMALAGIPARPAPGMTGHQARFAREKAVMAKQAWEAAQPQSYKYKKSMRAALKSAEQYMAYAMSELKQVTPTLQEAFCTSLFGKEVQGGCSIIGCYSCGGSYGGQYKYYAGVAESYMEDAQGWKNTYEAALAKEAKTKQVNPMPLPANLGLDYLLDQANDFLWDDDDDVFEGDPEDDDCICCG